MTQQELFFTLHNLRTAFDAILIIAVIALLLILRLKKRK